MIEHLVDITLHMTQIAHLTNKVEVRDGKTYVSVLGWCEPVELTTGDKLAVTIKQQTVNTFRYTVTRWDNRPPEVTSVKSRRKVVPRRPGRHEDSPALDTVLHDIEMRT